MKWIVYVAIALLGISNFALEGQFVGKGPFDAKYCAKVEPLKPNLVLSSTTHIHGTLVDGSGAPFVLSKIEVRRYISAEEQTFSKSSRQTNQEISILDRWMLASSAFWLLRAGDLSSLII